MEYWSLLWNVVEELPLAAQSGIVLLFSMIVMRIRTVKQAKSSRIEIARAVMIQKASTHAEAH